MTRRVPLSRRTFLRGAGVALGLPLLEGMLPHEALWAAEKVKAPKRIAFLYVPNGIVHDAWKPVTTGVDYELSSSLEPLRSVKGDVNVLTGLSQIPYEKKEGVGHARPTTAWLTGSAPEKEGVRAAKSVDQIIADKIGADTKFTSLELSISGTSPAGRCDGEFSCVYSSVVSWRDEKSPMPTVNDPKTVFKRLFGDVAAQEGGQAEHSRQQMLRASVLDSVLGEAKQLHRSLGKTDQQKLDEYLYSVRQIERRVTRTPSSQQGGAPDPAAFEQRPHDYAEHVRLMGDLMILAFQADLTRVSTFMLGSAAGGQTYPMLGIREGHHDLSHKVSDPDARAKLRKIDRYNVSLYVYIIERMKQIQEGAGTMLDNSLVVYGSGLGNGNAHTPFDLPLLMAGRAGGAVKTGQHVKYALDTPLNNLWMTVLDTMGAPQPKFGNSTGQLPGLLA